MIELLIAACLSSASAECRDFSLLYDPYEMSLISCTLHGQQQIAQWHGPIRLDRRALDLRLPAPAAPTSESPPRLPSHCEAMLRPGPRGRREDVAEGQGRGRHRIELGIGSASPRARQGGADVALNSFTDRPEDHALADRIAGEHRRPRRLRPRRHGERRRLPRPRRQAAAALGRVDILVNNAGIQHVAPIPDFPPDTWDRILAINLSSAFHTTAAALPLMRAQGWGRIVNIASAHGLTASPFKSAYVAAKHGVVGFTKVTALETAEEPITANAICPGYVLTPLVEAQIPDTMKQYDMNREQVIREVLLARQPSKAVRHRRADRRLRRLPRSPAADQITGTTLSVDGGWTAL